MGYQSIAIYGYGMLGRHLVHQLGKAGINVKYAIESQKGKDAADDMEIYSLNDNLPAVEAVIVTVLYEYEEICDALKHKIETNILPITKLLEW